METFSPAGRAEWVRNLTLLLLSDADFFARFPHVIPPHCDMEGATSDAAGASDVPKPVVKNVDMEADMQQAVVQIATDSMIKFPIEKDMAAFIKRAVDDQYGPTWHVIVGKSFGSYVTHGM